MRGRLRPAPAGGRPDRAPGPTAASAHRLDLAVEDPRRPHRMLVAVETDGPGYAAMRSTRDRDRLRIEQLQPPRVAARAGVDDRPVPRPGPGRLPRGGPGPGRLRRLPPVGQPPASVWCGDARGQHERKAGGRRERMSEGAAADGEPMRRRASRPRWSGSSRPRTTPTPAGASAPTTGRTTSGCASSGRRTGAEPRAGRPGAARSGSGAAQDRSGPAQREGDGGAGEVGAGHRRQPRGGGGGQGDDEPGRDGVPAADQARVTRPPRARRRRAR